MRAEDLKSVAVIGAGTVARAFAHDLGAKGVEVRVWARRRERALELAEYSGVSVCEEMRTAARGADVVLICVSDRAIEEVAQRLAEAGSRAPTLHTSGFHNEGRSRCWRSTGFKWGRFIRCARCLRSGRLAGWGGRTWR